MESQMKGPEYGRDAGKGCTLDMTHLLHRAALVTHTGSTQDQVG